MLWIIYRCYVIIKSLHINNVNNSLFLIYFEWHFLKLIKHWFLLYCFSVFFLTIFRNEALRVTLLSLWKSGDKFSSASTPQLRHNRFIPSIAEPLYSQRFKDTRGDVGTGSDNTKTELCKLQRVWCSEIIQCMGACGSLSVI